MHTCSTNGKQNRILSVYFEMKKEMLIWVDLILADKKLKVGNHCSMWTRILTCIHVLMIYI